MPRATRRSFLVSGGAIAAGGVLPAATAGQDPPDAILGPAEGARCSIGMAVERALGVWNERPALEG